ncbi:circularly permuted ATPgrasp domain protein [Leptospira perolatii]|uniref:Circularly permuted ATPgrasp domain protein n=1 Tax=Leptospira perolatii TaxID=2023191 RepID=A0A2M9ZNA3_9LEPT|nr:circularly permuted ATPgrasp domain protein [Leptospira perolatii]PJZ68668.1 circularly permuted ATPgrasp domain protein [Leptospira perolatii]PJZ73504.1 circularly permuted ATPgrasp domain protein [Leptospira perolatii]
MQETVAQLLNRSCHCVTLEKNKLEKEFLSQISGAQVGTFSEGNELVSRYFSESASFIDQKEKEEMESVLRAIRTAIDHPNIRKTLLKDVPSRWRERNSKGGVFLSLDFHLTKFGPKLIEINTNAGGAFLQLKLISSQIECCPEVREALPEKSQLEELEKKFLSMFLEEWELQGKTGRPEFIVIVDENPESQFLYPEFLLFQDLFRRSGIKSKICSPDQLKFEFGELRLDGEKVDLLYNRLTDFYLRDSINSSILAAWEEEKIVLTPNPLDYELYAKKSNLVLLSDVEKLRELGVGQFELEILERSVPKTNLVCEADPEKLWANRKELFFKPTVGYGSKSVYKGEKITKGVFSELLKKDSVYQEIVPPSERVVLRNGEKVSLKMDFRAYVYDEEILLLASRLYQGQTTNFRTLGGGFSPVYVLPNLTIQSTL